MARATTNNKALLWGVGGVTAVVLALTGYAAFSGDEEAPQGKGGDHAGASPSKKPEPDYSAPSEWTEPRRWAALPRGKRTDSHGNEVGFPHTEQGAVAMLAASSNTEITADQSAEEENVGIYDSYISQADRSTQNETAVRENAEQLNEEMRNQLRLAPDGALPDGAYSRSHVIGFKVIKASGGKVSAWMLSKVTARAGETAAERSSYTRSLVGARWEAGDWKLSSAVTAAAAQATQGQAKPKMAAPGDPAFNSAGWTAIREAS